MWRDRRRPAESLLVTTRFACRMSPLPSFRSKPF
jgi:hypothetical protein